MYPQARARATPKAPCPASPSSTARRSSTSPTRTTARTSGGTSASSLSSWSPLSSSTSSRPSSSRLRRPRARCSCSGRSTSRRGRDRLPLPPRATRRHHLRGRSRQSVRWRRRGLGGMRRWPGFSARRPCSTGRTSATTFPSRVVLGDCSTTSMVGSSLVLSPRSWSVSLLFISHSSAHVRR
jgi:hypothetical protein